MQKIMDKLEFLPHRVRHQVKVEVRAPSLVYLLACPHSSASAFAKDLAVQVSLHKC